MRTSLLCSLLYSTPVPHVAGVHWRNLLGSPDKIMVDHGLFPTVDIVSIFQKMLFFILTLCSGATLSWNQISGLQSSDDLAQHSICLPQFRISLCVCALICSI